MTESTPTAKPRRTRLRSFLLRPLPVALTVVLGALWLSLLYLTSSSFLIGQLQKQTARQTGSKLEVGSLSLSLLSGLHLENVRLYLPASADGKGYGEGGAVEPSAAFALESFDFSWRALALLRGCVCVDALHIRGLQVAVEQVETGGTEGTNWDAIARYRRAHPELSPPDESPPKPEPPSEPLTWPKLESWARMIPFPLDVRIEKVGMTDARIRMIQPGQKEVSHLGLDLEVWLRLISLGRIEAGVKSGLSGLRQGASVLPPLDLNTNFAADLDLPGRTIDVRELSIRLNNILSNEFSGKVTVLDDALRRFRFALSEALQLNLAAASPVVAAFVPHLAIGGAARVEGLKADGVFDLDKPLAYGTPHHPFPGVTGTIRLGEIVARSPEWGIDLKPFSFRSSLHAVPSGDDQLDLSAVWQGDTQGVEYQQTSTGHGSAPASKSKKGAPQASSPLRLALTGLTTSGEVKARWPAQTLPEAKVAVDLKQIEVNAPGVGKLAFPARVQVEADGDGKSQKGAAHVLVDVGTLANLKAGLECGERLSKVEGNWQLALPSIPALYALARHLDAVSGIKGLPDVASGRLLFGGRALATLPPGGKLADVNPLEGVSAQIDSKISLENATVSMTDPKVSLQEGNVVVAVTGPLQKLKVTSKVRAGKFLLGGAGGAGGADGVEASEKIAPKVSLVNGSLDLDMPTDIDGKLNPATLLKQLSTRPTLSVRIGSLAIPQALPAPLQKLELDGTAELRKAQVFAVNKLRAFWPGLGATVSARLDGSLTEALQPAAFSGRINLHLADAERKDVQPGITTSGGLDLDVNAKSDDMKDVSVDGRLQLQKLSVQIANKDKTGLAFAAEGMRGNLPFAQVISLVRSAKPVPPPPTLAASTAGAGKPVAGEKVATTEKAEKTPVEGESETDADTPTEVDDAVLAQESETKEEEELNGAIKGFLASRRSPFKARRSLLSAVSYQDVRPFMEGRSPIVIDRILAGGFEFGRSELDLSVSQNWISANEFLISFLGGKIQGSLQFAFDQRPVALRSSVHLTRLNTHKLVEGIEGLKDKARSWVLVSDPYIDGALHVNYDFLTSDMSGGVEVTSIGQEQLKMLLYFIDPDSQNPTITDIKRALNVGEVKQVSVPIKNGQIGLSVDVRLLKAPIPTPKLQRFPIAQLVDNFKSRSTAADPAKAR